MCCLTSTSWEAGLPWKTWRGIVLMRGIPSHLDQSIAAIATQLGGPACRRNRKGNSNVSGCSLPHSPGGSNWVMWPTLPWSHGYLQRLDLFEMSPKWKAGWMGQWWETQGLGAKKRDQ
jgi:hypothetical protein